MFALLIVLLLFCSESLGQDNGTTLNSEMYDEALILIQGHTEDGFIDSALMDKINEALRAIRSEYPEMEEIHARLLFDTRSLTLKFTEETEEVVAKMVKTKADEVDNEKQRRFWRTYGVPFETETGIDELDKLNEKYGVKSWQSNIGLRESYGTMKLNFDIPMDVATLKDIYESLPVVENIYYSPTMGDGDEIFFLPKGDSLHFVFKHGWGDCPSGCINNHYFYYTYIIDNQKVIKEGELPADKSRSGGIYRWGIPHRRAVRPFASFEDIKNKANDSTWWVSLHAVDVLGYLLTNPEYPRLGEDCSNPNAIEYFENVRDDVLLNKKDAFLVLIQCLEYPDEQVSEIAYDYLKKLSKEDFGNDSGAIAKWKKWLSDMTD